MWWFFIDLHTTLECIIIALVFACCLSVICFKPLGILQSLGYSNKKFLGWAFKKGNMAQSRLSILFLCTLLTCAVISLAFSFVGKWAAVISLAAYAIFFVAYFIADATHTFKSNAKLTPRLKRLYITLFLLFAIITYILAALLNFIQSVIPEGLFTQLKYCALSILPLFALLIICLANLIAKIWEKPISASYIKRAKAKLAEVTPLVIGVTGSYGKTTVKNVLAAMLSQKYQVVTTPASYNTPQGIAKSINEQPLNKNCVFIAEMGARQVGDIATLCDICPPEYSLITGVCEQHLQTFKSVENVIRTKAEIIAATKNKTIVAASAYQSFKPFGESVVACDCVSDVCAQAEYTQFTLTLGGQSKVVKTQLLGEHNAYNIGLCASLAYELGVPLEQIALVVADLPFVEHRLQLIKANGINILDDGYNSNPVGAQCAINALKRFGGNKVVVTPGLVELGVLEQSVNEGLGAKLVGLDYVILVGETLVKAVEKGYLANGGDGQKLLFAHDLEGAKQKLTEILQKGDAVLFLNDVPPQYL